MQHIQGNRGQGKTSFLLTNLERKISQIRYYNSIRTKVFITYIIMILFAVSLVILQLMPAVADLIFIGIAFVVLQLINKKIDKKIREL